MPQVAQATLDSADQAYTVNSGAEQVLIWETPGSVSVEFTEGGDVQYELRGGGGGGGGMQFNVEGSGGGSSGEIFTGIVAVGVESFACAVGPGGAAGLEAAPPEGGQNTTFGALTALGGGPGGHNFTPAANGGGGQGTNGSRPGAGALGPNGFWGGDATVREKGGGGAGAGNDGEDSTSAKAGDGGTGVESTIAGAVDRVGGGGAGSASLGDFANSGVGYDGGGSANVVETDKSTRNGTPGTGGGGAASINTDNFNSNRAGDGGSGAIILRFTLPAAGPTVEERSFAISSGADVSALSAVIESRSVALAPAADIFGLGGQDIALVTGNVVEYTYTITDSAGNVRVFNDTVTVGASSEWLLTVEGDDLLLSTPQFLALSGDNLILEAV